MALLNGIYIFVESEETGRDFDISSHPVEKGLPTTDHVNRHPATLDISGVIPGDPKNPTHSEDIRQKIVQLASSGSLVTYQGVNYYSDCLIESFQTEHTNKVNGAMTFSMTIREVLFATSPYDPSKKIAAKQTVQQSSSGEGEYVIHTVQAGDTIWDLCIKNNAPYKQYGWSVEQVIDNSPECFSRKSGSYEWRARSMQIGTQLKVGRR